MHKISFYIDQFDEPFVKEQKDIPFDKFRQQPFAQVGQKIVLLIRPPIPFNKGKVNKRYIVKLSQRPVQALFIADNCALGKLFDKLPHFVYMFLPFP